MRDADSASYDLQHEYDCERRRARYAGEYDIDRDRGHEGHRPIAPRDRVECDFCDGTGRSFYDDCDGRGEHITRACDCGECSGRGWVSCEEEDGT